MLPPVGRLPNWTLLAAGVFLGSVGSAQDAPAALELPCVADTSICLHEAEVELNQGGKRHLRLKGIQHILLLDFDWKPLAGRGMTEATLVLRPAGPLKLKTVGVSTVGTTWVEGARADEPDPAASCARWPGGPAGEGRTWAGPGTDFLDASFTAGGTIAAYRVIREEPDGSVSVALPPEIVHACLRGESHGIALSDEKGQTMANNDFRSREDGAGAVLRVVQADAPAPATRVRPLVPRVADAPAERPLPSRPGPGPGPLMRLDSGGRAWLAPEGALPGLPPSAPDRDGVPVFDVPRGGTLSLLVCAVGVPATPAIQVTSPTTTGFRVTRLLPLGRSPGAWDPLVPLEANPPPADGRVTFHVERPIPRAWTTAGFAGQVSLDQGSGAVLLPFRVRVPSAALSDTTSFQVSLNTYGSPGGILGDAPGTPAFLAHERQAYRTAHEHRATLTPLPYSQSGQVEAGAAATRNDDGTWDWRAWDARFGPLLSGEAFADLPRPRVPLDHFYLPLHENWPLRIADHYAYKGALEDHWRDADPIDADFAEGYARAFREAAAAFARHVRERGWLRTRFTCYLNNKVDYRRTGRGTSWWLLDEPAYRDDFLALQYFARLFRESTALERGRPRPGPPDPKMVFRVDLSRPEWRRDHLDGLMDLVVTNRWRDRRGTILGTARAFGEECWSYGEAPKPDRPPVETWAWAVRDFLRGADGMVPWQSVGRQDSWEVPEGTALILPPRPGMPPGLYPTLRLKMLRKAAETAELVRQVEAKLGWTRAEVAAGFEKAGILPAEGAPPPDAPDRAIAALCGLLEPGASEKR